MEQIYSAHVHAFSSEQCCKQMCNVVYVLENKFSTTTFNLYKIFLNQRVFLLSANSVKAQNIKSDSSITVAKFSAGRS